MYTYSDMENHLEAKSRVQGMLMGNRLRWQRWESSVLVTVPGAGTAEGKPHTDMKMGAHRSAPWRPKESGRRREVLPTTTAQL